MSTLERLEANVGEALMEMHIRSELLAAKHLIEYIDSVKRREAKEAIYYLNSSWGRVWPR